MQLKQKPIWLLFLMILCIMVSGLSAETPNSKHGGVKGIIRDSKTNLPIIGVSVVMKNSEKGTATDESGQFDINTVPIGTYTISFQSVGYMPKVITDVIVRAGRKSFVEVYMQETVTEVEGITVGSGYFSDSPTEPTSTTEYSAEEIRRAPGSAGDVSRIMFSLPSTAKVNDQINNLIVRGGSPTENSFYIENIEIPNINHYPLFGTSGGPISLVNTDFVNSVSFSAGGFSASYGDRLSSIMSIKFREGNREQHDFQADMNFAGFGLVGEGPLGNKGYWMASARRSYLDLLVDAIGTGVVPRYSDYQGKLVYDISPKHRLTFLGIVGVDYINFTREDAIEEGNITDGWSDGYEYAVGANWRYLWGNKGYSNTSLSYLATRAKSNYFESSTGNELVRQNNLDGAAQLRNVNFMKLNHSSDLEFGFDLKMELDKYDYYASEYTNFFGDTINAFYTDLRLESPKIGLFTSYIVRPFSKLQTTFGVRYDYFEYTNQSSVSPRFSLSYQLHKNTKLNAAYGIYNQTMPSVLLSQQASNKDLKNPRSHHYILGLEQKVRPDTRLTLEGYYKWYEYFPMNVDQPELFIIDEMIYNEYFFYHENLVDNGNARSYGVEATLQKKLRENFYGLVSASWSKSEYKDLNGIWRDRTFDNQIIFSLEGGYKPNEKWEYSLRWIFAGGAPYTPLDLAASEQINRSVYDNSLVNTERYPAYHSLNVRVDRRFNFDHSNMIVYFSIWNAYNRENIASYYWNEHEKKRDELLQWSMLPIFGIEYEF